MKSKLTAKQENYLVKALHANDIDVGVEPIDYTAGQLSIGGLKFSYSEAKELVAAGEKLEQKEREYLIAEVLLAANEVSGSPDIYKMPLDALEAVRNDLASGKQVNLRTKRRLTSAEYNGMSIEDLTILKDYMTELKGSASEYVLIMPTKAENNAEHLLPDAMDAISFDMVREPQVSANTPLSFEHLEEIEAMMLEENPLKNEKLRPGRTSGRKQRPSGKDDLLPLYSM